MSILARSGPRIFLARVAPRYPRTLGVGVLLIASACGKPSVNGSAANSDTTSPPSAEPFTALPPGIPALPFDADASATEPDSSPDVADAGADSPEEEAPDAAKRAKRAPPAPPAVPGGAAPPFVPAPTPLPSR